MWLGVDIIYISNKIVLQPEFLYHYYYDCNNDAFQLIMLYPWPCITAFCRGNCSLFRPANLGGCDTCRAGFTGAPECCECEPGKTFIDGVCSKCHIANNIDSRKAL